MFRPVPEEEATIRDSPRFSERPLGAPGVAGSIRRIIRDVRTPDISAKLTYGEEQAIACDINFQNSHIDIGQ